jgi:hypothetical protein
MFGNARTVIDSIYGLDEYAGGDIHMEPGKKIGRVEREKNNFFP